MGSLIDFKQYMQKQKENETAEKSHTQDREDDAESFPFPTTEEVTMLNCIATKYGEDGMLGMPFWNGEQWKAFFEFISIGAQTQKINPWDAFAVIMAKQHGVHFKED